MEVAEITIFGRVSRGTKRAAGYDLYSTEEWWLVPGEVRLIGTGVTWDVKLLAPQEPVLPYGTIGERSGLALKGLNVGGGIIDADYRNEIKVICRNVGIDSIKINVGERIGQLIIGLCFVGGEEVETVRTGGFGSTGLC